MNREARLDLAAAILTAGVIAAGVLFYDWPVFTVLALYWVENVVIGVFNVIRMLIAGARTGQVAGGVGMAGFFAVHYGFFCAGHAVFLLALFGQAENVSLFGAVGTVFERVSVGLFGGVAVLAIVASALFDTLRWSAAPDDTEQAKLLSKLMAEPYGRIVVLHVVLLGGGFLLQLLHAPALAALLLVALKLAYDVRRLRRQAAAGGEQKPGWVWKD